MAQRDGNVMIDAGTKQINPTGASSNGTPARTGVDAPLAQDV